jgi:hypothetical protein
MHSYIGSPEDEKRVNYIRTFENIQEAFGSDAGLFFYEDFFRPESIAYFENKIGAKIENVQLSQHVGKSRDINALKQQDYELFKFAYDDIFEFGKSAFARPAPWGFKG